MMSRHMPPYVPAPVSPFVRWIGLSILGILAAVTVVYLLRHPVAAVVAAIVVVVIMAVTHYLDRRLAARARERAGESICTLTRQFDRRDPMFDPFVIRAVWDALEPWTTPRTGPRLPLRATDKIADLGCVDDDFDDVAIEVAARTRRSLDDGEANPYWGRAGTVGGLVMFMSHQPRTAA